MAILKVIILCISLAPRRTYRFTNIGVAILLEQLCVEDVLEFVTVVDETLVGHAQLVLFYNLAT